MTRTFEATPCSVEQLGSILGVYGLEELPLPTTGTLARWFDHLTKEGWTFRFCIATDLFPGQRWLVLRDGAGLFYTAMVEQTIRAMEREAKAGASHGKTKQEMRQEQWAAWLNEQRKKT